jgi:PAS fold
LAIHGEVLIDRAGRPARVVGVLMDITRHVESMMASQINLDRVRATMSVVGGSLWTARSDGYCTDVLLRAPETPLPNALLGHNWEAELHPDDLDKVRRAWKQAAADNLPFNNEYRLRDGSRQYKWRRSYAAPVFADDGSLREWAGISFQIEDYAHGQSDMPPLTASQIRAARGILNWSVRNLADRTGLSVGVVRRLEDSDATGKGDNDNLILIKDALSAGGVDFFCLPGGEAGVFPTKKENRLKIVRQNHA